MSHPAFAPTTTQHPIHASLHRPVLFLGVAQGIAILEAATVGAFALVMGFRLITLALIAVYLMVVHPIAVWITARDPQMPALYVRSLLTKDFYAPHTRPLRPTPSVRPSIPHQH